MRTAALRIGLSLIVCAAAGARPAPADESCIGVKLEISTREPVVKIGDAPKLDAFVVNESTATVHVVRPGDGSSIGWRTPIVGWSVINAASKSATHPSAPPPPRGARDGNINALSTKDLLTLKPGARESLGPWIGNPSFPSTGSFRVVFYYRNDPDLPWKGIPLGAHDPEAMRAVKSSAKCALVSNELLLTVK
jgi:hypothetical protein